MNGTDEKNFQTVVKNNVWIREINRMDVFSNSKLKYNNLLH